MALIIPITTADAGTTKVVRVGTNKPTYFSAQLTGTLTLGNVTVAGCMFSDPALPNFLTFALAASPAYAAEVNPVLIEFVKIIVSGSFVGSAYVAVGLAVAANS